MKTLALHQDYIWFLALLAWSTALALIARRSVGLRARPWLGVVALTGTLTALTQLWLVLWPQRPSSTLLPGWDFALGLTGVVGVGCLGWMADGYWSATLRQLTRIWLPLVALLAGALRFRAPVEFGLLIAALSLAIGGLTWRALASHRGPSRHLRGWVPAFAATPILAGWGPWAHGMEESLSVGKMTFWGLLAAGWSLATGLWLLQIVWQISSLTGTAERAQSWRHEARSLRAPVIAWFAACGVLVWVASAGTRQFFEESAVARAKTSVLGLDLAAVARALGPEFRVGKQHWTTDRDDGLPRHYTISAHLRTAAIAPAGQLQQIERANPTARWAHIITIRDGYLVSCIWSHDMNSRRQFALLLRPVEPPDLAAWAGRKVLVEPDVAGTWDNLLRVRAPLIAANGAMLGWLALDWGLEEIVHLQAQVRALVFAVAALGGAGLFLWWLQRLRAAERVAERVAAAAAAAEVVATDRLKSRFLAQVSHELRSPVQNIQGFADLAAGRSLPAPVGAWLAAVQEQSRLLGRLIDDLIDVGMQQAGSFRLRPQTMNPRHLVTEACASLEILAQQKNLYLRLSLGGSYLGEIAADPDRLRQVLINLVGNAVKFSSAGGVEVSLLAEREPERDRVVLTLAVADTGPGIAAAERSQLFQPFARLEATRDHQGAGLGLALSREICRAMDGDLTLDPAFAPGARFVAHLAVPVASSAGAAPLAARQMLGPPGRRVLIVDDHPLIRTLFTEWLTQAGCSVWAVGDGIEAQTAATNGRFDVAVVDLAMPRIGGIATIIGLRSQTALQGTRIVVASAHASEEAQRRARVAGADAFVVKPAERREFLAAVFGPAPDLATDLQPEPPLREQMIAIFQAHTPAHLEELDRAIAQADLPALALLAHYSANSAAALDEAELGRAATRCEQACAGRDRDALDTAHALRSALQKTFAESLRSPLRTTEPPAG